MPAHNTPKICIASTGLGHVARGIEAWADDLARALHRRGVDVSLCKGGGEEADSYERRLWCLQRESAATKRLLGWTKGRLLWRAGLGSPYGIEQTTFCLGMIRHLRRTRADILHVQDPLLALRMQQARSLGLIQTRTILGHGTEESLDFLKSIEYLQHLAPWHAESARKMGVWRESWTTIPNFIDTDIYHPGRNDELRQELGIPRDALVVLSVAAIKRHHKRIDYLLQEFHTLRSRRPELPVWLVIAGGWENETDELIREGSALLGDRVRFLVRYPRASIPALYRAADVFVLTSLFEMLGIVLVEAMASGVPCLTHTHPILNWVVGGGGVTIDMAQVGKLADQLGEILSSPESRNALALTARQECVSRFAEEVVVQKIVDYYRSVVPSFGLHATNDMVANDGNVGDGPAGSFARTLAAHVEAPCVPLQNGNQRV